MENHAKYGDTIYFHGGDALYVNLFIAVRADWREQGLDGPAGDALSGGGHARLHVHGEAARTRTDAETALPVVGASTARRSGSTVRLSRSDATPGSYTSRSLASGAPATRS